MAAAHLFVDDLDAPEVAARDRHHVERVLRIRPGEAVTVSDGAGGARGCVFRAGGVLEPVAAVVRSADPDPPITVGFALVKNERPEWIVQKLTECGVDRIVPFVAGRSVVRWDAEKADRHVERWREIAREAAMQSRRDRLPEVADLAPFTAAAEGAALAALAGEPPSLDAPVVLVGPEGGWTSDELAAVPRHVSLGPTVLRAETAAVACGVLLSALRAGLVDRRRLAP